MAEEKVLKTDPVEEVNGLVEKALVSLERIFKNRGSRKGR